MSDLKHITSAIASFITAHLARFYAAGPLLLGMTLVGSIVGIFGYALSRSSKHEAFLNGTKQKVTLIDKVVLTKDTCKLRFGLTHPKMRLGLPTGKHLYIFGPNRQGKEKGFWNGQPDPAHEATEISRVFTPISGDELLGMVDFVVKGYAPDVHPSFPDGGKLSQWLCEMQIGDTVHVKGPVGRIEYTGPGQFVVSNKKLPACKRIFGIAGGSGITPIMAIARQILENHGSDKTEVAILLANKTEDDILLRDELEELAAHYPKQLKVWYTIDRVENEDKCSWSYSTGYIDAEMLRKHGLPAHPQTVAVVCGPRPMKNLAVLPALKELGYQEDRIIAF